MIKLLSSPSTGTTARASSVLKKNTKLYGPMNALDTTDESSCWNSDAVPSDSEDPIAFTINFGRLVEIDELRIQFQGGFAAEECTAYTAVKSESGDTIWKELTDAHIEPEDVNEMQIFDLSGAQSQDRKCDLLKLSFEASSDFYGRITIYKMEAWGSEFSSR